MAASKLSLDPNVAAYPMSELSLSARKLISRCLNIHIDSTTKGYILQDWRGLAEQLGFSYNDICQFERFPDPTEHLLNAYSTKRGATNGALWQALLDLERADIPNELLADLMSKGSLQ